MMKSRRHGAIAEHMIPVLMIYGRRMTSCNVTMQTGEPLSQIWSFAPLRRALSQDGPTNQPTNRATDRPTDGPTGKAVSKRAEQSREENLKHVAHCVIVGFVGPVTGNTLYYVFHSAVS